MAVTEVLKGLGSWGLSLQNVPQDLVAKIRYFGHISIHIGQYDYRTAKDSALTSSRYTGVVRKKEGDGNTLALGGPGMSMWLGDEDKKGDVYETLKSYAAVSFENTIRDLLPAGGAVTEGTLFNIGQNYTGSFVFQSPREAIEYVTETLGAEYIVRGDGTIDAGLVSDLYAVNPKAILIRKGDGADMQLRALLGEFRTSQDVEDFTTRAVLLANGSAGSLVTAAADINPGINPYRDIHGGAVKMTRLVSESATDTGNASARAQLALNRFTSTRDALTLSSSDFDIKGDVNVGDYLYIYDPELDLVDGNNEVLFRGVRYNPMKIRLTEMTWGVPKGYSAGYRDWTGNWYNLTEYLVPESAGSATLVVGGYNKSLNSGADGGVGGSRPIPDTTVPGVPTWVTPFIQSVYQSAINGDTKGQVQLKWLRPNNVDGSTIIDGDHYEIRWRTGTTPIFPSTHAQMSVFTHLQLKTNGGTYGQPIAYPAGPWSYAVAPWSELTMLLQELAPNMPYEAQIRAVDAAAPANAGAWSTLTAFQTSGDTLAPATPAPPFVAASRIAVQIEHTLGRSDGGTYNLDADLHHFDVFGEYEPNFTPSSVNLLGKLVANNGMIQAQVPAVGTLQLESVDPVYFKVTAVDNSGNASEPSVAVQSTALLIDDAHISDLTVSKVTAGTISADWVVGARIATAFTGTRVELNPGGIETINAAGVTTFSADAATGMVDTIGTLASGVAADGNRVIINERIGGSPFPEIRMYPTSGSSYAYINSINNAGFAGMGVNSASNDGIAQSTVWVDPTFVLIGRYHKNGPGAPRGGYAQLTTSFGQFGYSVPSGSNSWIKFHSTGHISFKGWSHGYAIDGADTAMFGMFANSFTDVITGLGYGATLTGAFCATASFGAYSSWSGPDGNISAFVDSFSSSSLDIRTLGTTHKGGRACAWVWQVI